MLVYWGFLLNKKNEVLFEINDEDLHIIINFCVMVEAIHKMSLLVDDWIDNDIARHGSATFHTIYGADTTVLLAMNILLKGYMNLNNKLFSVNEQIYKSTMSLVFQIAYEMTLGALTEISSKDATLSLKRVKEIIDLETSSIIRNSLMIGYVVGSGNNSDVNDLLDDIGFCCGYVFQALNDMEAFGNSEELMKHKGMLTTDILEDRKNLVIAYIYAWANKKEIKELKVTCESKKIFQSVNSLISKYGIKEHMLEEIENLQKRIDDRITKIEQITKRSEWCKHFAKFIDITISASKKRALG
jgi:heptaprenyl diphosphate synthase